MAIDTQLITNTNITTNQPTTNGNHLKKKIIKNSKSLNGDTSQLSTMTIEEQFNAAVNVIQNLPKNGSFQPSDELKLKFYAFYKQSTEGPNRTPKPSFYEIVNRYKHDAWLKLGEMTKEEAMKNYVNELKQILETVPYDNSMSDFYDKLGPFRECIQQKSILKKVNGESNNGSKINGNNQFTKDANYSSSNDSTSESDDDFSDTVDSLSNNGDSKLNLSASENGHSFNSNNYKENKNNFEDCTDVNSKLQPSDVINAKGQDLNCLTGQENYFHDCIDKNSMLNPNDIICARGETGIFSSRTNLPSNQDQTGPRSFRQPLSIDNSFRTTDGSYYQGTDNNGGNDGDDDRNFNNRNSELNDIHEHLALTVLRLQQTVKSISNRIENLEAQVNERQLESTRKEIKKQSWWSSRTTQTTVLLILWPFAAHLIITAIKKKVNSK